MTPYANNVVSSWAILLLPWICNPNEMKISYWNLHLQRENCPEMFTHHSGQVNCSSPRQCRKNRTISPFPFLAHRGVFFSTESKRRGTSGSCARQTQGEWVRETVRAREWCFLRAFLASAGSTGKNSQTMLWKLPLWVPKCSIISGNIVGHQTLNKHENPITTSSFLLFVTSPCAMFPFSSWPPISCRGLRSTMHWG